MILLTGRLVARLTQEALKRTLYASRPWRGPRRQHLKQRNSFLSARPSQDSGSHQGITSLFLYFPNQLNSARRIDRCRVRSFQLSICRVRCCCRCFQSLSMWDRPCLVASFSFESPDDHSVSLCCFVICNYFYAWIIVCIICTSWVQSFPGHALRSNVFGITFFCWRKIYIASSAPSYEDRIISTKPFVVTEWLCRAHTHIVGWYK